MTKRKDNLSSYLSKQKFGSADNITTVQSGDHDGSKEHHHGSVNLPSDTG